MTTLVDVNQVKADQKQPTPGMLWGPRVDYSQLEDWYAPREISRFKDIPGGIDNLAMTTVDRFVFRGMNQEFEAVFKGYVRVARASATTDCWATSEVYTNMLDMQMTAETDVVGPIHVRINPNVLCAGQIMTPFNTREIGVESPAKNCRIAVAIYFDIPKMELTLFNKEPIMLCIDGITTMPPGGAHGIGRFHNVLPLYNLAEPDGSPIAWITKLDFIMGGYLTEAEGKAFLARRETSEPSA